MIRQKEKNKCSLKEKMIIKKEDEIILKQAFFLFLALTLMLTTSSAFGWLNWQ